MSRYGKIRVREHFHKIIAVEGYKVAAEIGLGLGPNAVYLLENTGLEVLHSIDNWDVRGCRKKREATLALFPKYGQRFHFIDHDSSTAADAFFEDESLDYVYIDGDHRYRGITKDLKAWWPKVRKGGFFGGHDYVICRKCQVLTAVDEFFASIGRGFNTTTEALPSWWCLK